MDKNDMECVTWLSINKVLCIHAF